MKQWTKLPFVATNDAIFTVLETWPPEWRTLDLVEIEKVVSQKKKDDGKFHFTQLVEKRRKEKAAVKVGVAREVS